MLRAASTPHYRALAANARPAGLRSAPWRPVCTAQRARPPAAAAAGQQQPSGQASDDEDDTELNLPWDPETADVYIAWDLDNKRPHAWSQLPELCSEMRAAAGVCGRVRAVAAFANRTTFDWVEYDDPGLREMERLDLESVLMEEAQDELRCQLCGRRCKSLEDLQKHFKQLHQREHQKRMGSGSKKRTQKYLQSEKAERYRDAYGATGMSRKLSRKGRTLKALLEQLGVRTREVPTEKDAADNALKGWVDQAVAETQERDEKKKRKVQRAKRKGQKDGGQQQQQQQEVEGEEEDKAAREHVLVVVSDDYGFRGLLQSVRSRGWWAVIVSTPPTKFRDVTNAGINWDDVLPPPRDSMKTTQQILTRTRFIGSGSAKVVFPFRHPLHASCILSPAPPTTSSTAFALRSRIGLTQRDKHKGGSRSGMPIACMRPHC